MKKVENGYEELKQQLTEHLINCRNFLQDLTTEKILQMNIESIKTLKQFCDTEYPVMTKFLMVDLYHIIGMVNLTTRQTSEFYSMVKEYSNYRPNIKHISMSLKDFNDIPNIPVECKFRLVGIEGYVGKDIFTLDEKLITDLEEDTTTIEDYQDIRGISEKNSVLPTEQVYTKAEVSNMITEPDYSNTTLDDKGLTMCWRFPEAEISKAAKVLMRSNGNLSSDYLGAISKIQSGKGYGLIFYHDEFTKTFVCILDKVKDNSIIKLIRAEFKMC